jgi:hypothetical protein
MRLQERCTCDLFQDFRMHVNIRQTLSRSQLQKVGRYHVNGSECLPATPFRSRAVFLRSLAILSQIDPDHTILSYSISLRSILTLSTHLRLRPPSGLFLSVFPTSTIYAFSFCPIRATWPAHFILLELMIQIILGEEYKSWSSSLRSFLHSPDTSSLFGPNILFNTLFSPPPSRGDPNGAVVYLRNVLTPAEASRTLPLFLERGCPWIALMW